MSVSGISVATSNAGILQLFQLRSQALKSLESAVQSGDVGTAQDALATLDEDAKSTPVPSSNSATQSSDPSNSGGFASDLTALLQAVQSGNLADAQQAASALQGLQDTAQPADSTSPGGTTSSSSQSTNATGSGGFGSDLTTLVQAVQSGNLADAQQAASALQNAAQQAPGGTHAHRHHHRQASSADPSSNTTSASATSAVATAPDNAILLIQAYYLSN